jgi:hypothetical protein
MLRDQPSIASFFRKCSSVASEDTVEQETQSTTSPGPSQCDAEDIGASDVKVDKFQESWLKLWPWLEYGSTSMFCVICKKVYRLQD